MRLDPIDAMSITVMLFIILMMGTVIACAILGCPESEQRPCKVYIVEGRSL